MKKTLLLLSPLVFFISFSLPTPAVAGSLGLGATCSVGSDCVTGYCDPEKNICDANPAGLSNSGSSGGININAIKPYTNGITNLINGVFVPLLFAIAFITFLWGVYKYFILGAAEEKSREEGRQFILWGIIGFVVIISVWGLVNIVLDTFNLGGGVAPTPPTL